MDNTSNPEYLRTVDLVCEPDRRSTQLVSVNIQTGRIKDANLADQHSAISRFVLNNDVPEEIRIHFETAKNLYLYAWFVFRFYPVAEQQALASLEFSLRVYLKEFVERYIAQHRNGQEPGLGALLRHAIKQQVVRNEAFSCRDRWALNIAQSRYRFEQMNKIMDENIDLMEMDESTVQATAADFDHDWLSAFIEYIPAIRNDYAHGRVIPPIKSMKSK
jgi:hypothetical protein